MPDSPTAAELGQAHALIAAIAGRAVAYRQRLGVHHPLTLELGLTDARTLRSGGYSAAQITDKLAQVGVKVDTLHPAEAAEGPEAFHLTASDRPSLEVARDGSSRLVSPAGEVIEAWPPPEPVEF